MGLLKQLTSYLLGHQLTKMYSM